MTLRSRLAYAASALAGGSALVCVFASGGRAAGSLQEDAYRVGFGYATTFAVVAFVLGRYGAGFARRRWAVGAVVAAVVLGVVSGRDTFYVPYVVAVLGALAVATREDT